MEIPAIKRKEFYIKALAAFTPGGHNEYSNYSCNYLGKLMTIDYPDELRYDRRTYDTLVKEYLPEYYEVLKMLNGEEDKKRGVVVIHAWRVNAEGHEARCNALKEAIRRVSLIINDNQ